MAFAPRAGARAPGCGWNSARYTVAAGLAVLNGVSDAMLGTLLLRGGVLAVRAFSLGQLAARGFADPLAANLGPNVLRLSYVASSELGALPVGRQLSNGVGSNMLQNAASEVAGMRANLWSLVPFVATYQSLKEVNNQCAPVLGR